MTLRVVPSDDHPLRVLANVHRIRIMALLAGRALTAAQLTDELGLAPPVVNEHLRLLATAGVVVVKGEGPERRYERIEPPPTWTVDARDVGGTTALTALAADVQRRWNEAESIAAEVRFDGELWVDPRAWGRACEQVRKAVETLRTAAATPHAPGTVHVSATAMLFGLAERDEE